MEIGTGWWLIIFGVAGILPAFMPKRWKPVITEAGMKWPLPIGVVLLVAGVVVLAA